MAKLHAARCPTCGANIQVPPHAHSVTCRYCSNVITVAHQKPPPTQMPGMPSTTLYIDPEEIAKAGRRVGCIIASVIAATVILPLLIGIGPWACGRIKAKVRPFPAECAANEEIELSGDWTGTGPVIAKADHNCKVHISHAKLKGTTLLKTSGSNVEVTLEDVTIETTGPVIEGDSNLKIHLVNATLTSTGDSAAIKVGHNVQLDATASKITGKKAALETEANAKLTLTNGTELSSEGVAIKTKSNMVLDAQGGKIDGGEGAIVATSGTKITGKSVTFHSKNKALQFTSSTTLDLTDGAVTGLGDSAIESDGGDFSFAGTKVQGTTSAITARNGLKLKASKKAALTSTSGDGLDLTSNGNLTFTDATLDGARNAVKSTVNLKVKLLQGARFTGKKGGIVTDSNLEVDATGATIDGGTGPGLDFDSNAKVQMQQGTLKGTPALKATYKPSVLTLEGTKVEGEQVLPKR